MSNLKLLAISSAVATGLLFAQGERATISGTVTDTSQAVVPGVAITVRNVDTNVGNMRDVSTVHLPMSAQDFIQQQTRTAYIAHNDIGGTCDDRIGRGGRAGLRLRGPQRQVNL